MGGFVHNVSTLKKVSFIESICASVKFGLHQKVYSSLVWLGRVFHGFPPMQRRRLVFFDIAHRMFGYHGIPHIRKFNGNRYLQSPLGEDEAWSLLVSLDVKSTLHLAPVYDLGNENYVLAYWYYDGGSDGREEYEIFSKKVDQFFSTLPISTSWFSIVSQAIKEAFPLVAFVCLAAVSLILFLSDVKEEQQLNLIGSETLTYKIAARLMQETLLTRGSEKQLSLIYRQPEGADLPALFIDISKSFNNGGLLAQLLQHEASKYGCVIDEITGFTDRSVGVDFTLHLLCSYDSI